MMELDKCLKCVEHYIGRMSPFAMRFVFGGLNGDEVLDKVREAYPSIPKEVTEGVWRVPEERWRWVLSEEYLGGNGLK